MKWKFIGWQRYGVKDFIPFYKYFNCQLLGHVAKCIKNRLLFAHYKGDRGILRYIRKENPPKYVNRF